MKLKKPKKRYKRSSGWGKRTESPNEGKYHDPRWKAKSKAFLEAGGTIPVKRANGTYRFVKECIGYGINPRCKQAAVTTDHHINPAINETVSFWDQSNWRPMCRSCHAIKSNRERAAAKKDKRSL